MHIFDGSTLTFDDQIQVWRDQATSDCAETRQKALEVIPHVADLLQAYSLYLPLVLQLTGEMDEALEHVTQIFARHRDDPNLNNPSIQYTRIVNYLPWVIAPTEKYDRIIGGENVGCLEDEETHADRAALMDALKQVREILEVGM
jgi:hypothetical protein